MFNTDILFTGFYGHQNTGDDAFVEVCSWGADKFWNKSKIRFLARKETLPDTLTKIKGYPVSIPKTYTFQSSVLLNDTDYLISGGGSTIHSEMRHVNPKSIALRIKDKGKRIKIGGIGVSIGPFKSISDEKAVERYLKSIDFIALRDQASYDYATSLELPYKPVNAFDLAALLPDIYNYRSEEKVTDNQKTIGISVCPYESLNTSLDNNKEKQRNNDIIELIKSIDKSDNIHFKFYIINGHERIGDYILTNQIINESSPQSFEIVHYNKTTYETWLSISMCDFVISTRLHAAIFACFAGVPFMLNEYHRKCSDFLENVGYEERYRLYNSDFDIKHKVLQIKEIINNPPSYLQPTKVEKMREMAKLNFTAISL